MMPFSVTKALFVAANKIHGVGGTNPFELITGKVGKKVKVQAQNDAEGASRDP